MRRARRLFDLDAYPHRIAGDLGRDPLLASAVRRFPGTRVPGAWDGFEMSVRAILGQQDFRTLHVVVGINVRGRMLLVLLAFAARKLAEVLRKDRLRAEDKQRHQRCGGDDQFFSRQ